jgi:hypothetical protein
MHFGVRKYSTVAAFGCVWGDDVECVISIGPSGLSGGA